MKMVIVSSREFRANQRKYFDLARTNDVVITSRSHGSYRLISVTDLDIAYAVSSIDPYSSKLIISGVKICLSS